MHKKLLFISSANLTTNPRLLKELKFAVESGNEVSFIGFDLDNWSQEIDNELIKGLESNFTYIPATRKNKKNWIISSLIEKTSQKLFLFFKTSLKINAYAHSKRSFLLNNFLKKHKKKYDIISAHTLATLYPAYKFAKRKNIPFVFDIEDYHPGENISNDAENEKKRREFLMKKIMPKAAYITYASPLIGEHSLKLLNNDFVVNHQLINNCFSQSEFRYKENNSEKVKFVWFSQNIAAGRGLELILPALYDLKEKVELHLIGNLYQNFYDEYLKQFSEVLHIHKPLNQVNLNLELSVYDVGLAIELNSADFNRQICLTNKIWAYLQAGLYILATDTYSQKVFLEEHEGFGVIVEQKTNNIQEKIEDIIREKKNLIKDKQRRFEKAKGFSWEKEQNKVLEIWKYIIP